MRRDEMEAGRVCAGGAALLEAPALPALLAAGHGVAALRGRDLRLSLPGTRRIASKVLLVDAGELRYSQAGRRGRLAAGQFTLLAAHLPVEIEAEGAYAHSLALLPGLGRSMAHGRVCGEPPSHRPIASFVHSWAAQPALGGRSQWHLAAALMQMLGVLHNDGGAPDAQAQLRSHALALIESQLAEITVSGLAEQMSVSRRHLDAVFSARGETVSACIWRCRITRAAQLLRLPGAISITALAHELGFKDSSHFSRLFRRHHGVTPTQWRSQAGTAH
ncbi:helix-turn-helix domain-containing protein [Paucibacter soli]|uniref:helix-turn-helix domain-containing protein n=1 Tax=Paucibacter soli TaxID=3133433 RepID=UPI0030A5CC8F